MTPEKTASISERRCAKPANVVALTLRVIADATKISVRALEALERNDIARLPAGIFSRAFVRAYARGSRASTRSRRSPSSSRASPSSRSRRGIRARATSWSNWTRVRRAPCVWPILGWIALAGVVLAVGCLLRGGRRAAHRSSRGPAGVCRDGPRADRGAAVPPGAGAYRGDVQASRSTHAPVAIDGAAADSCRARAWPVRHATSWPAVNCSSLQPIPWRSSGASTASQPGR